MTSSQSAASMRTAARRIRSWTTALLSTQGPTENMLKTMLDEADRLESDAEKFQPSRGRR